MSKQEKVAHLLTETVRVLCQSSFDDWSAMKIQGLLAITINSKDIFLVQINEAIDSCLSPTTTSQPCSNGVQRATKTCVSDNSKDSTDCNNGIVASSCRQSLRSASKSVEKVLNYETVKNTNSKKKVLGNKKKNKGRRKWQKRTNKYSVANSYQQHQDGRSKCAKRLTTMRKPLLRRKCKIVRATRAGRSNSIVQMEMCGSDDDFSNNFDRKEARTNCMLF